MTRPTVLEKFTSDFEFHAKYGNQPYGCKTLEERLDKEWEVYSAKFTNDPADIFAEKPISREEWLAMEAWWH